MQMHPSKPSRSVAAAAEEVPSDVEVAMRELAAWAPANGVALDAVPAGDPAELAAVQTLDPPAGLNDAAKKIWWAVLPWMAAGGRSSPTDLNLLTRYCSMMSLWNSLSEFVTKNGTVYTVRSNPGPDGTTKPVRVREYPQVQQMTALAAHLLVLERELGLG